MRGAKETAIPILPTPASLSVTPPHFSSIFCSPKACSFGRSLFRWLARSPPGKGKETAATQTMKNMVLKHLSGILLDGKSGALVLCKVSNTS